MPRSCARDALRSVLESLQADDLGFFPMTDLLPRLRDFAAEFGAPDFVSSMHPLPPTEPAKNHGPDGIIAGWDDFGEAFTSVLARLEAVTESPGGLVVDVEQRVRTRHGDVEITQPVAVSFVFERDRLTRVEFHLDRDAAHRAVSGTA